MPDTAKPLQDYRPNLPEAAYAALKVAISSGQLQPRDRLSEAMLAKKFSMSRTPVRQAIQRLINEGLAESGLEGAYVTGLSVEDFQSLGQVNLVLQLLATQLAASQGTDEDMQKLEEWMARMEACSVSYDFEGWTLADQALHRHLFQMSRNRWLDRMLLQMESLIARVSHVSLRVPERIGQATREHREIVDAIKRRDADTAQKAMREHLTTVEKLVTSILTTFVAPISGNRF